MSSRQKSSRPEVQFSPPRSARQSKPKAINGSSSERRRPHLSHSQGDVVTNGDRHNPSGGPALHNQEVAHPRDRRQDWAQNHNYHDAVHDNGYRYTVKIVPLDMKGCTCHFAKWQMHPFISKGRNATYV